ncbi:hypothetical protein WJX74_000845 [Apatococcus lobatus]|uniref:Uncharacterized protein n=1 Tax=Apatococcus lobatus TaxID=904363 RepID=A0AAW1QZI3_9CHLO
MSRRCREHRAEEGEAAELAQKVELRCLGRPKGTGVVARRDLQKGEFVGVLAGRVIADRRHARLAAEGAISSRYSMETCDRYGAVYVVEPEDDGTGVPARRFAESFGHYMNEPAPGERLNVAWAHNKAYDPQRIDCYTVKAGPVRAADAVMGTGGRGGRAWKIRGRSNMKVLAIDVGVKHLSYCLLADSFEIKAWEVLTLGGRTIEDHVASLHENLRARACLLEADKVIIERQMRTNPKMSCIASAMLMYFLQNGKDASYIEASKKMGAFRDLLAQAKPGSLPKAGYQRTKAQSVMCARFVLQGEWLEWFEGLPKKNDASDSLTQAWSYLKDMPVQL